MRQKKMLGKPNINVVFLLILFCFTLTGCGENSIAQDGDIDVEDEIDSDQENELDEEERERPENPPMTRYPKTLWREEVEVGEVFTWGFFARDYYPEYSQKGEYLPIVWDNDEGRILAVDSGRNSDIGDLDFVIYSLTEEHSEILAELTFPDLDGEGWEWQNAKANVYEVLLVDGRLFWSFRKGCTYLGDAANNVTGVLSYELQSGATEYLYWSLDDWGTDDTIGTISQMTSESIALRRDSGFYRIDLNEGMPEFIQSSCKSEQEYRGTCTELFDTERSNKLGFRTPGIESKGLAFFNYQLVSLEEKNGRWDIIALGDMPQERCIRWSDSEECSSEWLSFDSGCCVISDRIIDYNNETWFLSGEHATLFKVDFENRGFQRKAGITLGDYKAGKSPDGTPVGEAAMGGDDSWIITDDGDVMWVCPYDFSVRGIAGPLEEWAK